MTGNKMKVAMRGATTGLLMGLLAGEIAQADAGASDEVKAVSDAFYGALNEMLQGTPISERVASLWLDAPDVTAQHPLGGRDTGLATLVGAFDGVASMASGGTLTLEDQAIAVFGDTAVETGVETGTATLSGEEIPLGYRVTNVYTLTDDGWRMVHHHTDLSPPLIDLMARLGQ
ncbi:nuclear transport factor 2 family protein [Maribius pontilimi]|uniref:Nuclear transport factor 2 family protein n=1 Tax=Palleronia pontilimi TaxID=1964209 RepID=A0A934IDZ6_9RHOB|nr:DUF4440 domain-containing protein [Palleronia pontilimi]MBJ3761427.1 nuclear transport factor 2 family protein [Palleronia pontilimi]